MKLVSIAASMALIVGLAPAAARAETYSLSLVEHPGGILSVSGSLYGVDFTQTLSSPYEQWNIWPSSFPGNVLIGSANQLPGKDGQPPLTAYNYVAWLETSSEHTFTSYNILSFGYSGNLGIEQTFFASEVPDYDFHDYGFDAFHDHCWINGNQQGCPVLTNGQTMHDIPLVALTPNGYLDAGTLSIQFTDLGDVGSGVPEAPTWAMMVLGFVGVGLMVHRRKSKAAATAA